MSHNHGGKSKRQGHPEAARRVIAMLEGEPIPEPPPEPEWATRRGEVKLHCGNLSYDVTEADVRELFARCGEITECHLFKDNFTGKSRGFACVRLRDQAAGDAALAMDGWEWAGRDLKIKLWGFV